MKSHDIEKKYIQIIYVKISVAYYIGINSTGNKKEN